MTISAYAAPVPKLQFTDNTGAFLSGGKLFTYAAGTTTKATTYQDAAQATPNTNPIVLDAEGRCTVFLPPGTFYKFTLSPSTDTDPPTNALWTVDSVGVAANGIPYALDTGTANVLVCTAVVGVPLTATASASIIVKLGNAITAATTLEVTPVGGSTWGAIAVRDQNGNALSTGAGASGQPMLLTYDGTFWRAYIVYPWTGYAVDTGTQNVLVATVPQLPLVLTAGISCLIKAAFTTNGATTFAMNGTAATAVKDKAGNAITNNIAAGQVLLLTYDGTNWRTLF